METDEYLEARERIDEYLRKRYPDGLILWREDGSVSVYETRPGWGEVIHLALDHVLHVFGIHHWVWRQSYDFQTSQLGPEERCCAFCGAR